MPVSEATNATAAAEHAEPDHDERSRRGVTRGDIFQAPRVVSQVAQHVGQRDQHARCDQDRTDATDNQSPVGLPALTLGSFPLRALGLLRPALIRLPSSQPFHPGPVIVIAVHVRLPRDLLSTPVAHLLSK